MEEVFTNLFGPANADSRRFAVISGDFPRAGIAIPLMPRKVMRGVFRHLLLYKGKSFTDKLKIKLFQWFYSRPLLGFFSTKQFSVAGSASRASFSRFLNEKMGGGKIIFSIYVGSRKLNLPLFSEASGALCGFARVYFPGETAKYGENEVAVLRRLEGIPLATARPPQVLWDARYNDFFVVALSSGTGLKNMRSITSAHLAFLKELSEKTSLRARFEESGFNWELQTEISFIRSHAPANFAPIERAYVRATEALCGTTLPFSLTMREFPYFQMMETDEGNVVVDFEHARFDFPPLFDLFSLLLSAGPYRQGDYVSLYEKNIMHLFFSSNGTVKSAFEALAPTWNMNRENAYVLFSLFLVDQLYIHLHAGHDASAARVISFLRKLNGHEEEYKKKWLPNL